MTDIEKGLKRLRQLRLLLLGFGAGIVPAVLTASLTRPPEWVVDAVVVLWMGAWVAVVLVHGFYRCPACHRWFNARGLRGNFLTPSCMHCGLPLELRKAWDRRRV
jgi:hypothetical protein